MSELKDSLYDISDAIILSQRLVGASIASEKDTDSPYIRFSSDLKAASEVALAPKRLTVSAAVEPPLPTEPFRNWEEVLKWCVDVSKAKCGFIVDSQGFVMMMHGDDLPRDGFEGAGANLGVIFSYLNQMEIDAGNVCIVDLTYEKRSMLAVRVTDTVGEYCTLGIIVPNTAHSWPKDLIFQQIMKSMSNLSL